MVIYTDVPDNTREAIYISEENTSGAEFKFDGSKESIKKAFIDYIDKYYVPMNVKYVKENKKVDKKVNVMEALTEEDIEELSKFSFTDEELAHILSLFELISDENKDKAFGIIKALFEGKKLVDDTEKSENVKQTRNTISERYTRILLGNR